MKKWFTIIFTLFCLNTAWGYKTEVSSRFAYIECSDSYRSTENKDNSSTDVYSALTYRTDDKTLELTIKIEYRHFKEPQSYLNGLTTIKFFDQLWNNYTVKTEYNYQPADFFLILPIPETTTITFDLTSMKRNGKSMSLTEVVQLIANYNMCSIEYNNANLLNYMPIPTASKLKPQLKEMSSEGKKIFGSEISGFVSAVSAAETKKPDSTSSTTKSTTTSSNNRNTNKQSANSVVKFSVEKSSTPKAFFSNLKVTPQSNGDLFATFDLDPSPMKVVSVYFYLWNNDKKQYIVYKETGKEFSYNNMGSPDMTPRGWTIKPSFMKSYPAGSYTLCVYVTHAGLSGWSDKIFYGPMTWNGQKFTTSQAKVYR